MGCIGGGGGYSTRLFCTVLLKFCSAPTALARGSSTGSIAPLVLHQSALSELRCAELQAHALAVGVVNSEGLFTRNAASSQ